MTPAYKVIPATTVEKHFRRVAAVKSQNTQIQPLKCIGNDDNVVVDTDVDKTLHS